MLFMSKKEVFRTIKLCSVLSLVMTACHAAQEVEKQRVNVMVVGKEKAGKTSLLRRYRDGAKAELKRADGSVLQFVSPASRFSAGKKGYVSYDEKEYKGRTVRYSDGGGVQHADQKQEAHAIVLVVDAEDEDPLDTIRHQLGILKNIASDARRQAFDNGEIPIVLAFSKTDKLCGDEDAQGMPRKLKILMQHLDAKLEQLESLKIDAVFATSAKRNVKVAETMDYAFDRAIAKSDGEFTRKSLRNKPASVDEASSTSCSMPWYKYLPGDRAMMIIAVPVLFVLRMVFFTRDLYSLMRWLGSCLGIVEYESVETSSNSSDPAKATGFSTTAKVGAAVGTLAALGGAYHLYKRSQVSSDGDSSAGGRSKKKSRRSKSKKKSVSEDSSACSSKDNGKTILIVVVVVALLAAASRIAVAVILAPRSVEEPVDLEMGLGDW